jgi:aldose 1-epimerase
MPIGHTGDTEPMTLMVRDGLVAATIEPTGGRLAQLSVHDVDMLVGADPAFDEMQWGSYAMVPWAGRVRRGRFEFAGSHYQLPINLEPHSIHGVGYRSEWTVASATPTSAELTLQLPLDESWPFGGTARQRFDVTPGAVRLELDVVAGDQPMPVSFGWHPWFRKPDAIDFRPNAMYRRDSDHITVDELIEVPVGPWDDCFVNVRPVRIAIDGVQLELSSDCTDWVVYDEPAHATCIEPQTGPPDAFNIRQRVLQPGERHGAWYLISISS